MYRFADAQYLELAKGYGAGTFPLFPAVNSADPLRGAGLGQLVYPKGNTFMGGGQIFQVVKAVGALTKNRIVSWEAPITCTAAAHNAAYNHAGQRVIGIDSVAAFASNGARGGIAFLHSAADTVAQFPITASTATSITIGQLRPEVVGGDILDGSLALVGTKFDEDDIPAEITHDDTFIVIRPFHVVPGAASGYQCGVTYCDVTDKYYTLIQKSGTGLIEASGALAAGLNAENVNATTGAMSTADTGTMDTGTKLRVLKATSGAGVAGIAFNFPLE